MTMQKQEDDKCLLYYYSHIKGTLTRDILVFFIIFNIKSFF
jgi:hypothetical protein